METLNNIKLAIDSILAEDRKSHDFDYFVRELSTIALMCLDLYNDFNLDIELFKKAQIHYVNARNEIFMHFNQPIPAGCRENVYNNCKLLHELFMREVEAKKPLDSRYLIIKMMGFMVMNACGSLREKPSNIATWRVMTAMQLYRLLI
jgi:hypothetical protein